MFNQISLTEGDQRFHRFIWPNGEELSCIVVHQWLRVLFGDKPSPDLAGYALRFLAEKFKVKYPRGAFLEKETYVDDIVFSDETTLKASEAITEVDTILAEGKFNVKLWNSNVLEIDQNIEETIVDVLGHVWYKRRDTISLKSKNLSIGTSKFTKRPL